MNRGLKIPLTAVALTAALTACAGELREDAAQANPPSASATPTPAVATPSKSASPTPTPSPTLTPVKAPGMGEVLEMENTDFTVVSAKESGPIKGEYGADGPRAGEDGTLFLLEIEYTNKAKEAISKECWGPHWVEITVFDTQDREMLESNDSGHIPGNNCSTGILSGQSGHRYVAFEGPKDAEIGYAVFDDYTSQESMPIILNPDLTLQEQ
jgi:hypothetical protein